MSPLPSTLQSCSSSPQTVNLASSYLNSALSEHLVCELRNNGIQKQLLSEENFTLAKVGEIAQGMEAVKKNAKRLQGRETVIVNKVFPRREKNNGPVWRKQEKSYYCC